MGVQTLDDNYKEIALSGQWEEQAELAICSQQLEHRRWFENIIKNSTLYISIHNYFLITLSWLRSVYLGTELHNPNTHSRRKSNPMEISSPLEMRNVWPISREWCSVETLRTNLLPSSLVLVSRDSTLRRVSQSAFVFWRVVVYKQDGNINTWRRVFEVPKVLWNCTLTLALEEGQEVES